MSVLVDTSVWTDHFRGRPAARPLVELLETAQVVVHPFVLGELALGGVPRADTTTRSTASSENASL